VSKKSRKESALKRHRASLAVYEEAYIKADGDLRSMIQDKIVRVRETIYNAEVALGIRQKKPEPSLEGMSQRDLNIATGMCEY